MNTKYSIQIGGEWIEGISPVLGNLLRVGDNISSSCIKSLSKSTEYNPPADQFFKIGNRCLRMEMTENGLGLHIIYKGNFNYVVE